ncbi:MAG: hypothetical protein NTW87_17210 [Planctomycetota bacterium]|nr:hypothetical protein [Planctomycetota bacterium]
MRHLPALLFAMAALVAFAAGCGEETGGPKPEALVRRIKVLTDKAPDCTSLKAAVESVTRECKTNDEKAIAIYNFMLLTHYHLNYPSEPGGVGALREINVYGWSLCGGLHSVQSALWRELGWEWRFVGWTGHTTVEAQYDGRWHYLDVFLKYYGWMPDANAPGGRTIAGEDDIKGNPALVTEGLEFDAGRKVYFQKGNKFEVIGDKANWRAPAFLVCGDTADGITAGVKTTNRAGSPTGWAGINFDSPGYSTDVNLAPGYSLTLTWDAIPGAHWWNGRKDVPGHTCGDKDYRNCPAIGPVLEPYRPSGGAKRSYANGKLLFAPDLSNAVFLKSLAAQENVKFADGQLVAADANALASITVALQSPYIMTRASGQADGADSASLSLDGGKTFKPIKLEDFSDGIGGQYACLVKLSFKTALKSLRLEATVQCSRCALPYLSPGANKVSVSLVEPKELGDNQLVVTYAWQVGSRSKSYEEIADAGAEVARAHYATWSSTPTVVQKTFRANELPAEFDIPVPTAKDKQPVYPRMLFLRREVLAPGSKPLPLPEGAAAPQVGPNDELKTLPSPFTVGLGVPPVAVVRKTATRALELRASHAVSLDGQALENHFIKWKEGETWVMLVSGDLKDLPPPKRIAAARLVFPVVRGHAKASTKVGVTWLNAPFEPGKPYDFKNLGDLAGTAVVPRQPTEAAYDPPKTFASDVTRALKKLAAGEEKFNGFALRTVPDRGVDEGYIVRFDMPTGAKVQLELDVYEGE